MRSTLRYVVVGIAITVITALALFTPAKAGERKSIAGQSDPPSVGHDPAGHGRPGPESQPKQESSTEQSPSQQENVMTLSPERLQAIGVKFEPAKRRSLDRLIRTVGQVEIDERRLAHVNIKLEGWIDELFVNSTGERVKKGKILFTLYSPELVATQTEYLLALKSQRTLGQSTFPEVAERAKSLLEVTHRRLKLWDITENHIQDLEHTGEISRTLPIHAPLTGTVIKKVALAGMHVKPGDELYTIADLSQIWITADIYEYELPFVKVGQTATVTLSYDPRAALQGRIVFIYPTLDPQTRTAKVRFELANPGELLKPGMYTNVELKIPLGTRLVVSTDAILDSGERQLIFIHLGGGRLEWRTVKLGVRAGDWVEVLEGLKEEEHIVTSANFLIDSESQLKAAVSGMKGMKH
ncbi:MAG TPA: efflux RND transporter periplasmic adaptor subunit [Candidatus Tectomicrobia bacterium]|nr:efflux RND transporter periplasmic adaptor subunit [Candidatus Tectomicrobia bacterium]